MQMTEQYRREERKGRRGKQKQKREEGEKGESGKGDGKKWRGSLQGLEASD